MDSSVLEYGRQELETLKQHPGYWKFLRKRERYFLNVIYPPPEYMQALGPGEVDEILAFPGMKRSAIYVHIPFCSYFCHYCHYYKVIGSGEELVARYLAALKREIAMVEERAGGHSIESVYIGGGTPAYLSADQIADLLGVLKKAFRIRPDAEVTFEVNPTNATPDKYAAMAEGGVTRVSIGVQSFQDRVNEASNRRHSVEAALRAFEQANDRGFVNINLDLINGLRLQTLSDWLENLAWIGRLKPMAATIYYLRIRDRTPTGKSFKRQEAEYPPEEELILRGVVSDAVLERLGYRAPIVDYFVRELTYSHQFDLQVWGRTEAQNMIGIGTSAYSYTAGRGGWQYVNAGDLKSYVSTVLERGERPIVKGYRLSREERMRRSLFLGLKAGISDAYWREQFGSGVDEIFPETVADLVKSDVVTMQAGLLELTRLGRLFADEVGQAFIARPRATVAAAAP